MKITPKFSKNWMMNRTATHRQPDMFLITGLTKIPTMLGWDFC